VSAASGSPLDIAVAVDDPAWREALPEAEALCRRAAAAALARAGARGPGEVSILLTDDRRAAALNERYRGVAGATNVLSFAAADTAPGAAGVPVLLGDVVVARETVEREARAQGKTIADHLAHLVVHGILHLLGHDHEGDAEVARMERLEAAILDRLAIANPYRAAEEEA
jgi:probable rRNA maturation factor